MMKEICYYIGITYNPTTEKYECVSTISSDLSGLQEIVSERKSELVTFLGFDAQATNGLQDLAQEMSSREIRIEEMVSNLNAQIISKANLPNLLRNEFGGKARYLPKTNGI